MSRIVVDTRWKGHSGIARFSREVISRLKDASPLDIRCRPMSPWEPFILSAIPLPKNARVYFSPSFTTPWRIRIPFVFTIHDLIHIRLSPEHRVAKRFYYRWLVRSAARRAFKVLTVSEFSRRNILEWSGLKPDRVVVVGAGVSKEFTADGGTYEADYPYLIYVGNFKAHKNVPRMLRAFAQSRIPKDVKLVMTTAPTADLSGMIAQLGLTGRVAFVDAPTDEGLASLYRGARGLVMASICEGFGLPALEAMACGTPVVSSTADSLPEIAGDAAIGVDPLDVDSIAGGIQAVVSDEQARKRCVERGLARSKLFTWDKTARAVQAVLSEAAGG